MSKLVFYKDKKKEHRWRFVASNGKVLADSGEGYKRKVDARVGWASMRTFTNRGAYAVEGLTLKKKAERKPKKAKKG